MFLRRCQDKSRHVCLYQHSYFKPNRDIFRFLNQMTFGQCLNHIRAQIDHNVKQENEPKETWSCNIKKMLSSNIFCGLHKCTLPAFIRAVGLVIRNDSIKCIDLLKETTISVLTTRPLGATADVFRCKSRDICHLYQTREWIWHNMSANLHHRHGVQCQCVTPLSLSTLLVSKAHSNMISQKYSCKWTTLQLKGSATKLGFSKLL